MGLLWLEGVVDIVECAHPMNSKLDAIIADSSALSKCFLVSFSLDSLSREQFPSVTSPITLIFLFVINFANGNIDRPEFFILFCFAAPLPFILSLFPLV